MDDEMRALREELKGKEGVISMMKEKTRMFVTKMKQDHEAALGAKESELQKTKSLLELANGRMGELVVSSGAANSGKSDLESKLATFVTEMASKKEEVERIKKELDKAVGATETLANENAAKDKELSALNLALESSKQMIQEASARKENQGSIMELQQRISQLEVLVQEVKHAKELADSALIREKQERQKTEAEVQAKVTKLSGEKAAISADMEKFKRQAESLADMEKLKSRAASLEESVTASAAAAEGAVAEHGKQVETLTKERDQLRAEVDSVTTSSSAELQALQAKVSASDAAYTQVQVKLQESKCMAESLKEELAAQKRDLEGRLKSAEDETGAEVRASEKRFERLERDLADAHKVKHELEKQVSKLEREKDALTTEVTTATKERDAKVSQLEGAEERMAEMKKKTKAFVENLVSERTAATNIAESKDAELRAFRQETQTALQQRAASEEQQRAEVVSLSQRLDKKSTELTAMQTLIEQERAQRSQLEAQRESELGSSKQEMEEYKTKRIAARNEMIQLAGTLEKIHEDVANLKHTLQFVLTPMVTGQIKGIEAALRGLELTISQIASPNLIGGSGSRGPDDVFGGASTLSSVFDNADESPKSGNGGAKPLHTANDALEQAELLRGELAKSQSGITLLSQAITRLDAVIKSPDKNGCCDASLRSIFFGCLKGPSSAGTAGGVGSGAASSQPSHHQPGTKASSRISDRITGRSKGQGYNRLLGENSSHDGDEDIEMPQTPGGRFTIEDE